MKNDIMTIEYIRKLAAEHVGDVIHTRRHLHAHPELSFKEYETAAFIRQTFDQLNIPWRSMAETGTVAEIIGSIPSDKVIALRADIDALPIIEENQVGYRSVNKDIMHACGHDAHTSSLLGVAAMLHSMRDQFGGTVKLIFQPGEEVLPGGAGMMISEGVLENPVPAIMIGQHVAPFVEAGKIAIRPGKFMASMDEIKITIKGKGGHAAQPHRNIDPVMIAAQMLVAMQQLVSRFADPTMPTVLSFGKFIANGAINIIPDEVYIEGTFRTLNEQWREEAHTKMIAMATGLVTSMGAICDFQIKKGYPSLINNDKVTQMMHQAAKEYIGAENVLPAEIWMAAEDFARYAEQVPACFYLLGTGNVSKGITSSLHTPGFDIDESALELSIGLMTYATIRFLQP